MAQPQLAAAPAERHRQRQRVAATDERVAEGAVERADQHPPRRASLHRGGIGRLRRAHGLRARANDRSRELAGRGVRGSSDPVVGDPDRDRGRPDPAPHAASDTGVHLADLLGGTGGRVAGEVAEGGDLVRPHPRSRRRPVRGRPRRGASRLPRSPQG